MTPLIVLALQAALTVAPPIWPATVTGWVTLLASAIALCYVLYDRLVAKVRRDAELNGLGERVNAVEGWQREFDASATERALVMERITTAQEQLLQQIGEAKASAAACHADTERLARELAAKIDSAMDRMSAWERRISMQMHGLETELRARGVLAVQPPAPPALPLPPSRQP